MPTDTPRPRRRLALVLVAALALAGALSIAVVAASRGRALSGAATIPVASLAFSPTGDALVVTGSDQVVRVWNLPEHRFWFELRAVNANIGKVPQAQVAFSADERLVATAFHGDPVRLLEMPSRHELSLGTAPWEGGLVALDAAGSLVAGLTAKGVALVSHRDASFQKILAGPTPESIARPRALALTRRGDRAAFAATDGLWIWSTATGELLAKDADYAGATALVPETAGAFRLARLVPGLKGFYVLVTREPGHHELRRVDAPTPAKGILPQLEVALSPSGELLAVNVAIVNFSVDAVPREGEVRVYSVADGRLVARLARGGRPCQAVAISADDQWIATAWHGEADVRIERLPR